MQKYLYSVNKCTANLWKGPVISIKFCKCRFILNRPNWTDNLYMFSIVKNKIIKMTDICNCIHIVVTLWVLNKNMWWQLDKSSWKFYYFDAHFKHLTLWYRSFSFIIFIYVHNLKWSKYFTYFFFTETEDCLPQVSSST